MSNPQVEKGYTRIANEILEALAKIGVGGGVRQVIDVVIRKTYGFNKSEDHISVGQFMEATGLARRTVIYALQEAEAKGMIRITKKRNAIQNDPNIYRFNKHHHEWVVQNSAPQAEKNRNRAKVASAKLRKEGGSAKLHEKVVQNSGKKGKSFAPTKDTLTKDNTKDSRTGPEAPDPRVKNLIDFFFKASKAIHRVEPIINGGQVGKLLKERIKKVDEDRIEKMVIWYLTRKKRYQDEKQNWHEKFKNTPDFGVMLSNHHFNELLSDEVNALTYMQDNMKNVEGIYQRIDPSKAETGPRSIADLLKSLQTKIQIKS